MDFHFKKQFGQNFISDYNLLEAIVADAGITPEDTVIEVGAGGGTLTAALARRAKKVVAYEIDTELKSVLDKALSDYGNAEVIFQDVMKVENLGLAEPYKVVANLPYYITAPIIMRFLELENPPVTMSVMLQKEVAERLVAVPGTKDYGIFTLVAALNADCKITRIVERKMFYPVPNVDSATVTFTLNKKVGAALYEKVKRVVKAGFAMRRKTLVNNLKQFGAIAKPEQINAAILSLGYPLTVRAEELSLQDFITLSGIIFKPGA